MSLASSRQGRSLELYFIDGRPDGMLTAEVFNWTGQPAASIPAGFTKAGLPVGLQIVGRHLDDAMVMRASAAYEQAAPWKQIWPGIVNDLTSSKAA